MEPDDPLGWMMMDACPLSSSEDSRLRRCSYFGMSDSDDSSGDSVSDLDWRHPPDIPVAPFGITMVSPPESPEEELPNDRYVIPEDQEIFHTPPESRSTSTSYDNCNDGRMFGDGLDLDGEALLVDAVGADSRRDVDLGRDTDLGFSELEVDSTQRIEANSNPDGTFPRESEEIRVSKRGFSPKRQLSTEYPSKMLKSFDFESRSEPGEGSLRKRRLDFSTEVIGSDTGEVSSSEKSLDSEGIECDTEERNMGSGNGNDEGNSGINKDIVEDIDQVRYTGGNGLNSNGMEEEAEGKRALPSWAINVRVEDDESADEELEDSEMEMPSWANGKAGVDERADELEVNESELPSWANGTAGDDERADEEREVNETELPSQANDRAGDDERADEEMEVNETVSPLATNDRALADDRADEKLEVNEMELPSWPNGRAGDEDRADEELEVNEMELPSLANGRVGDDERVDEEVDINEKETVHMDRDDEELEVNEMELPSFASGRVGNDVRFDEELDVNERETVHLETDSDSLSEDFEEVTHSDVLLKLEEYRKKDRRLECLLSLVEVAERKWGTFSSDE